MSAAGSAAPGRVLGGRYQLDALLARGGMAEVWSATDHVLGRPVAVKLLHPHLADDEALRARFHHEAIAAARLAHPSIVATFDTCHDGGTEAIVMELVRGRTLRRYLDERGHLEPVEVVHVGAEVASALSCAHRAGVVHRDVKPANILLSDDGRVLVTDFGIAKVLGDTDVTRTSTVLGTVKYLAPEQVEGTPVDGRTDLYALAAVLYECLTGVAPFAADNPTALALSRLHQQPAPPSTRRHEVPTALDGIIGRAMARRADERYASADAFRAALLGTRLDVDDDPTVATSLTTPLATHTTASATPGPAPTMPTATHETPSAPVAPGLPPKTRRRPSSAMVVGLLIVAALSVTALLVASTDIGRGLFADDEPSTDTSGTGVDVVDALPIVGVTSYDPEGTGEVGENEDLAPFAADGDPSTEWQTQAYTTRAFGNLKAGLGLVLDLGAETDPSSVRILSPVPGWSAQVHVADVVAPTIDGWGAAVGTIADASGDGRIPLTDATGSKLLIWFTDLGASAENRMVVTEATVVS